MLKSGSRFTDCRIFYMEKITTAMFTCELIVLLYFVLKYAKILHINLLP